MELSEAEQSFKKQKSRVAWLALGGKNTKFFHHKVASNKMRNKILSLIMWKGLDWKNLRRCNKKFFSSTGVCLGKIFIMDKMLRAVCRRL